jgi:transcriptional regulator with XRE-family HTH domain
LPAALTSEERLEHFDREVEELKRGFVEAVRQLHQSPEVDTSFDERWAAIDERLRNLRTDLHPEDYDKEQVTEVFSTLFDIRDLLDRPDPDLDTYDQLLLGIERIRHIVRDALDEHVSGVGDDVALVLQDLTSRLPETSRQTIAELVGVDRRTLSRWAKRSGRPPRRLRTVARIVAVLRHNWTEEGMVAWFYRARRDLDGRKPITVLGDSRYDETELIMAARSGRSQYAT